MLKEEFMVEYGPVAESARESRRHFAESDRRYRQQSSPHHGRTALRLGLISATVRSSG